MSDIETLYELSNCELMRLEVDDDHYYYGGPKNGDKEFFMSVTQVLDIGGPFPEGLRNYLRVTNYEEQKERLEVTGNRGKILHDALDRLMRRELIDLEEHKTTYEKDAIVTFIQMAKFLDPKKFETELIVADPELKVAGTLDFKGFVDEWKLEALMQPIKYLEVDSDGNLQLVEKWLDLPERFPKRKHIIIDWKFTGRNAYGHKIQVMAYRRMNNKSYAGRPVSRAFTWRYSPKHKFRFDFSESLLNYRSFTRIYDTTIEYLGEFPAPPVIRRYPKTIRLYEPIKQEELPIEAN